MPTDYQRKYVECIKVYHRLHAELAGITMKLISRLRDMDIPAHYKSSLNEVVYDGADSIRGVDITFRDLVRADWVPPEERDNVMDDGEDGIEDQGIDDEILGVTTEQVIADCSPSMSIMTL